MSLVSALALRLAEKREPAVFLANFAPDTRSLGHVDPSKEVLMAIIDSINFLRASRELNIAQLMLTSENLSDSATMSAEKSMEVVKTYITNILKRLAQKDEEFLIRKIEPLANGTIEYYVELSRA